jgi:hypothetical protein
LRAECKHQKLTQGGTKPYLIDWLKKWDKEIKAYKQAKIGMRPLSTEELLALQHLEELLYNSECQNNDLVEFWSVTWPGICPNKKAKKELENLANDKAIVTSDYKMKILSFFSVRLKRNGLVREEHPCLDS